MKTIQTILLLVVLMSIGCSTQRPVDVIMTPERYEQISNRGDGTLMGCRELAVYFAAHEVLRELGVTPENPGPVAVEMYWLLYATYRATRLDETNHCECLLRRMVVEKEAHGMDVPDLLDVNPIG